MMNKKFTLLILFLFLYPAGLFSESSVWRVTAGDNSIYIGGTSHLLRQKDYPLPVEFEHAFRTSNILVFETDLGGMLGPEFQQKMLLNALYEGDKTIKDDLSPDVYDSLVAVSNRLNFPLSSFLKFKPFMLLMSLMTHELQKNNLMQVGVDQYFYDKAIKDSLEIDWLETIDEQLKVISSMGKGDENTFVKHSLKDMFRTSGMFEDMIKAWRNGDALSLNELFIRPIKLEMPILYQDLFVHRNKNWLPKIEQFLSTKKSVFILVGVGHLVGENSVLHLLYKSGYKIEKLETGKKE
jgi:uncharacterized protein